VSRKETSKDAALEALDFIINVLKEHEKDLDRLADKIGTTLEKYGETGELTTKITDVEGRLARLQNQISDLIQIISQPQAQPAVTRGLPVIVRCRQWQDFKNLATNAETLSYLQKGPDRTFQADAIKNGRVLTYTGPLPPNSTLLKTWLSKELNLPPEKILEGALALG
jgi:tRNA(Ser,Leu) C12 N-acetylase TAN1